MAVTIPTTPHSAHRIMDFSQRSDLQRCKGKYILTCAFLCIMGCSCSFFVVVVEVECYAAVSFAGEHGCFVFVLEEADMVGFAVVALLLLVF